MPENRNPNRPNIEPHDLDAERALLGAMLVSKSKRDEALGRLKNEDFYDEKHRYIFMAMETLHAKKMESDVTTVTSTLNDYGQLSKIGGVEYLLALTQSLTTVGHSTYYTDIIQTKSMLRRIIHEATDIMQLAYNEVDDVPAFLAQAESKIMAATKNRVAGEFKEMEGVIKEISDELSILAASPDNVSGVKTGFKDLDNLTLGFHPGALIVIAARPAMGKTAFALNIAHFAALESEFPVAVFSLEMDAASLVKRIIGSMGEIKGDDLKTGNILKKDANRYYAAAEKVKKCNLYIDDSGGITINDIAAKCRQLKSSAEGLKLVVVDYLQLIIGSGKGGSDNRQQEVSDISRRLKALARELEVPIIALSQLSRGVEQRQDKRPMLSDLRESGAIEQDADMVSFIYRDGYYKKVEEQQEDNGLSEIIIAKHRNGPTGTVQLVFQSEYSRFTNLSRMSGPVPGQGVKDVRS